VLISGSSDGPGGPRGSAGPDAESSDPNLVIIDAATRKEIKQLNLGGNGGGILMDPGGARAYVANSGGNKVEVVNLESLKVIGEVSPLGQPDGMAWAARK
jgi:YVTN family beta-propeller protein